MWSKQSDDLVPVLTAIWPHGSVVSLGAVENYITNECLFGRGSLRSRRPPPLPRAEGPSNTSLQWTGAHPSLPEGIQDMVMAQIMSNPLKRACLSRTVGSCCCVVPNETGCALRAASRLVAVVLKRLSQVSKRGRARAFKHLSIASMSRVL